MNSLAASVLLSTFDSLDCLWLAFTSCRVLENDLYFEGKLIPFVYFCLLLGLTLIIKQHIWHEKLSVRLNVTLSNVLTKCLMHVGFLSERRFSNFSCMFLNPNNFFQSEF